MPGQSAPLCDWIAEGGDCFSDPVFRGAFLRETTRRSDDLRCPDGCGCRHVRRKNPYDGGLRAVCQCDPRVCNPEDVKESDFTIWELRTDGVCRRLAEVFGAVTERIRMTLPDGAYVVGAWPKVGFDRRTVFLCLPYDQDSESITVNSLLSSHKDFIFLSPRAAPSLVGLLYSRGCRFVDLSAALSVADDGRFLATDEPWRIFGLDVTKLDSNDDARQKALVKLMMWAQELDENPRMKPPDHFTILKLYCYDELSTGRIAKRFPRASLSTVKNRKSALEAHARASLDQFRHMSGVFDQFEKTSEETRNPKAYRKGIAE